MTHSLLLIVLGFVTMVWAADRLIAGASATARNLGVSPLIIGLTIVGFGTSAPELVVSAIASLQGAPGLALGNAIGSNIANIGLILGMTALIHPLRVCSKTLKREFPILMVVTTASIVLLLDNMLSRTDGIILLVSLLGMTTWMAALGLQRPDRDPMAEEYDAEIPSDMPTNRAIMWLLVGLVILPASSHLLVLGAADIAMRLGVSNVVIGLTVVAIGTSLPELAAAIASAVKKEYDIAIGNIIGSNMFNLLGVLGIAGTISPMHPPPELISRDVPVMVVLTLLLFVLAYGFHGARHITRKSGLLLLAIYLGYQTYLINMTLAERHATLSMGVKTTIKR